MDVVGHPETIQTAFLLDHVLSVHAQSYDGDNERGSGRIHPDVLVQVVDVGLESKKSHGDYC